jgi:predicted AAA+ superfamily ATPase
VSWWREGHDEVDFVLQSGPHITAIEVKSAFSAPPRGLAAFQRRFPRARALVVGAGSGAIPLERFLERPAGDWVG